MSKSVNLQNSDFSYTPLTLLSPTQIAAVMGLGLSTVYSTVLPELRAVKLNPNQKCGRRFRASDVAQWIESHLE